MADPQPFNVSVPQGNEPNYLFYSRGTSAAKVNPAMGDLFKNVGAGVADVAKWADTSLELAKDKDVRSEKARTDAEFGIDNPANPAPGSITVDPDTQPNAKSTTNGPLNIDPTSALFAQTMGNPVGLSGGIGDLKDLLGNSLGALKAGKLSQADYDGKTIAATRQLYAKYPGYERKIDDAIAHATGEDPSNHLRRLTFEAQTAADQGRVNLAKEYETFGNAHIGELETSGYGDWATRKAQGRPYPLPELQKAVGVVKGKREDIAAAEAQNKLDHTNGENTAESARKAYVMTSTNIVGGVMRQTLNSAGEAYGENIAKTFETLDKQGRGPTTTEQTQLESNLRALETNARIGLAQEANKQRSADPNNPHTYASDMNPKDYKEATENAMMPITAIREAISNKDWGTAAFWSRYVTHQENEDISTLTKNNPGLRVVGAARKVGGDNLVNFALQDPANINDLQKGLRGSQLLAASRQPETTLTKQVDEAQQLDGVKNDPKYFNTMIDDRIRMITRPEAAQFPEETRKWITHTFGPGNEDLINKFANSDRQTKMDTFARLGSPQMDAAVAKASANDPKLYQMYSTWKAQTFTGLMRQKANDLQGLVTSNDIYTVGYDAQTHQFSMEPTEQGKQILAKGGVNSVWNRYTSQAADTAIKEINQGIKLMVPVLEHSGEDANKGIAKLMMSMGFNPVADKEGSLLSQVQGWVHKNLLEGAPTGHEHQDLVKPEPSRFQPNSPAAPTSTVAENTDAGKAITSKLMAGAPTTPPNDLNASTGSLDPWQGIRPSGDVRSTPNLLSPATASLGGPVGRSGLPHDIVDLKRTLESPSAAYPKGGDPNAYNTRSGASGPDQFVKKTWLDMVKKYEPDLAEGKTEAQVLAMRNDEKVSRRMSERLDNENAATLTKLGVEPTAGHLYLGHFLGGGDMKTVLKADPNTPLKGLLRDVVLDQNPFLRKYTAGQLIDWADTKMKKGSMLLGSK